MRTSSIGAIAALTAVSALVVLAGPAATRQPGGTGATGRDAFRAVAIDRVAARVTTLDTFVAATPAAPLAAIADPGLAPVPTRPSPVAQPVVRPRGAVKPAWRVAEYSWYGPGFYGSGTACGQTYSRTILGVAHRTLPCGTRVTLRNPRNGRTITVRVIDRGPYVSGRTWDLSRGTCVYLGNCYTGRIEWQLP